MPFIRVLPVSVVADDDNNNNTNKSVVNIKWIICIVPKHVP